MGTFQKRDIFGLVSQALRIYASDPLMFLLTTAMIYVPIRLVERRIGSSFIGMSFTDSSSSGAAGSTSGWSLHAGITGNSVVASVLTLAGFGLAMGLTSRAVAQIAVGKSPSMSGMVRGLGPVGALAAMLCAVVYGFLYAIGSVLLVVPGVVIAVWLLPFGPVVAIEGGAIWESLGRAARLVLGNWWYVFVTLLLVILLVLVPELVLSSILLVTTGNGTGTFPGAVISFVWGLVGGTLILITVSAIHLQLRVRREALTPERLAIELQAGH